MEKRDEPQAKAARRAARTVRTKPNTTAGRSGFSYRGSKRNGNRSVPTATIDGTFKGNVEPNRNRSLPTKGRLFQPDVRDDGGSGRTEGAASA